MYNKVLILVVVVKRKKRADRKAFMLFLKQVLTLFIPQCLGSNTLTAFMGSYSLRCCSMALNTPHLSPLCCVLSSGKSFYSESPYHEVLTHRLMTDSELEMQILSLVCTQMKQLRKDVVYFCC